jgi:uncharacterized protein (TIGR02246 family)
MYLKPIFSGLILMASSISCAHTANVDVNAGSLSEFLDRQATDWNRGDLAGFCAVYAENAVFISPSGRTVGRQAILDRYQKKYDTPQKRGQLELKIEHERILGQGYAASVILRWKISYPDKDDISGWSMIVLEQIKGKWMIIKDASM